ncbi:hypothetical protein B0T20DRAFT_194866 [Sordaria brevicollis]|uniref:Nuclear GTPase SLIP-GC n=1 Tax=Sordaria brevicollis TaxID=83679 RepID=A0AAE0PG15_SORBR|nr:hypothetical protein B0T20DRAFT_194866 [Sordaria brevicollis]
MSEVNAAEDSLKLVHLQRLKKEGTPTKLEAGLESGMRLLDDIKAAFSDSSSVPEIAKWIKSVEDLQGQSEKQRTVVGVVGSTGAGKSSVINAVLDQEDLVPTSNMRACTAVITEIAFNESNNAEHAYRGEVHFITKEQWIRELQILYDDLNGLGHSNGNTDDNSAEEQFGGESDAAIALDKIRCVYPEMPRENIRKLKWTPQALAQVPSVVGILGTVKEITAPTCKIFMDQLKKYIDSKEKTRGKKKEAPQMEFWPLIKVVRIFVKSQILEPGLVLVDLPGVQDSNAARSAVASKYIEECTGLWVIAPITRAVDDKAAQKLLGTSFKRQMQFDGTYSAMTVICSKADDISVTEALRGIPDDHKARSDYATVQLLESNKAQLDEELLPLEQRLKELKEMAELYDNNIDALEAALERADGDKVELTFQSPGTSKRKPRAAALTARKRLRKERDSSGSDTEYDDSEDELNGSGNEGEEPEKAEPLSKEDAETRLKELKAQKKASKEERRDLEKKVREVRKDCKETRRELKRMKDSMKSACIQYRNEHSRPVIQHQFAEGVRELDQESAALEDEETYDPTIEKRDYRELAARLPVFCVSSRAYQKMSGKLDKDEPTTGFLTLEETEIPALQRHALEIVSSTRSAACRKFLTSLSSFITSLEVQIVIAEKPLKLADNLREEELAFLKETLDKLRKTFYLKLDEAFVDFKRTLESRVIKAFKSAVRRAANNAIDIVEGWGKPKIEGGLPWGTYRATCSRDGVFKGAVGPRDFNTELLDPLQKRIAPSWEQVFSRTLPQGIDALGQDLANLLEGFQGEMHERPQLRDSSSYELVREQVKTLGGILRETAPFICQCRAGQKEANRLFKPAIEEAMKAAYEKCVAETGNGCYKRMKDLMREHIDLVRKQMFNAGTEAVTNRLNGMLEEIRSAFEEHVDRVVAQVSDDYKSIVLDRNIFKALASAREVVRELLHNADNRFKAILEPPAAAIAAEPEDVAMGGMENYPTPAFADVPVTPNRLLPFIRASSMPPTPVTPASHSSTPGSLFAGGLGRLSLFSPAAPGTPAPPSTPTPAAAPADPIVKTESAGFSLRPPSVPRHP